MFATLINMKYFVLLYLTPLIISCSAVPVEEKLKFQNREGTISVDFGLGSDKDPYYLVYYNDQKVLDSSGLGLIREDRDFSRDLEVVEISKAEGISESYTMLQGKQKDITYEAQKYVVHLKNKQGNLMDIIFQISDDGVAFRYHFPENSAEVKKITEEKTSYNFIDETTAWLQPMSKAKTGWNQTNPSYEEDYVINVDLGTDPEIGEGWVYPALFRSNDNWALISEVDLPRNYAGTRLIRKEGSNILQVSFPQEEEVFPDGELKPQSTLPWTTPWRIITLGSLKTIVESTMGTDLASPSKQNDRSYIEPGFSSWSWVLLKDDFTNYETSMRFIDYASNMNWEYCLIDADWDRKIGYDRLQELVDYAEEKDVKILVWYNSAGSWNTTPYTPKGKLVNAEDRNNEFKRLKEIGVAGIKVDFFGGDGQSMIAYYHDIMEDAAKHQLVLNFHGATLPRGWQRTYPNLLTVEAIKGYEFITFAQETADKAPAHSAMLPFTRNVFDPMDFTPMVLDQIPGIERKTTPAFELALPVLFLSGIQHIAEIPEGMEKQPDYVLDYLREIPVNWDESRFISGFPGKEAVIARKKGDTWHVAGINGENTEKELKIDLSFLDVKKEGILITDGENELILEKISAEDNPHLSVTVKENGGFVIKF